MNLKSFLKNNTQKKVESEILSGYPKDVIPALERSLSQYERFYKDIKVGITGRNPQERFKEHQENDGWERMVVKYKSSSEGFVNLIEDHLSLKSCQQYATKAYAENIILLDTGHAKMMAPFFPLEKLRSIPGFENARY